jgi:hypothetical protein
MSAPWCIVLNENILIFVHNNILELASDDNGNWAILGFWDWFGFEMWLEGS